MKTAVQDSSIAAYRALPVKQLATQADRICNIVETRGGDWSLSEIQAVYISIHGGNIQVGTVSARVNELIAAKRLERLETIRSCKVNEDRGIHPVRIPVQESLQ
ncbi:hypothetical protein SAMN05216428_102342 [Nitrosospira sp. Nsp11]|uniref:hypothetical protein n=1 Tax=Nitrosospira sp. Nsp11 TaxID=1855338 RepID=UPI000924090C|nr:hypothetical protein [Nitrosospira sp. Nsp11]SHL41842.1 hypothetical protein SAMN05216428_102342 [Nitrosospira sp. Nsp11]